MKRQQRISNIVLVYPFGLLIVALVLNFTVFGIASISLTLPSPECLWAVVVSATLLVVNHTWLMTATELTRVRYGILTTPEEWKASGKRREEVVVDGVIELERHHNVHRNTSENTVYFVMVALVFSMVSPPTLAAYGWLCGFAVARLGYTYSYLYGQDGLRGLFMSLSLVAMYGMASYLLVALFRTTG